MKWVKTVAGIVLAVGFIFGFKFYNKFRIAGDVKTKLLAACAEDSQCTASVSKHFDACFDANYNLGGRRRSGGLNSPEFVNCINEKAGETFTYQPEK